VTKRVVSGENLLDEALGMAKKIAKRSSLAVKLSRAAIDLGLHSSFDQILEIEACHMLACVGSQNQKKFVEKKLEEMKKRDTI